MEYKLYNSNTLKSVQVNEDTNLIFELAQANNTKVFLNTLLYSSQYGCPISFSLIRNLNSTRNIGFGEGAVLDFMYEITNVFSTTIKLKHPTGEIEIFEKKLNKKDDNNQTVEYFYSTETNAYIKKSINEEKSWITNLTYYNGSLVCLFEYSVSLPIKLKKYTRNIESPKCWITVSYLETGFINCLVNEAEQQEIVRFLYVNKYKYFTVSKKFDKETETQIFITNFTYNNNKISEITQKVYDKTTPIRKTLFTNEPTSLTITNDITKLSAVVTLLDDAVESIQFRDNSFSEIDKLSITYVDNYETKVQYNGMWEKYFFDYNYNLQHIENSVGQVKAFQYDNTQRRLLLLESSNLFAKNDKNCSNILDNSKKEHISYNGYTFTDTIDETCPTGKNITKVNIYERYEDEQDEFTFRFTKKGKRFDVENVCLWYKIIEYPEDAADNDISVYLLFYKIVSSSSVLIRSESVFLNCKIKDKWFFNILAAQAADDYDYVDVRFSPYGYGYDIDFKVELLSDSFANIYKYDEYGRVTETLAGKQIQRYKYNEDSQLVTSSNCLLSYDQFGKPCIVINSNNIQQEITRDEYGNITLSEVYNKDRSKYIKSTKGYIDKEHLTTENTETNENLTYLYDNKKRMYSVLTMDNQTTLSFIENDNANYGKVSKIMHSYKNITNYINTDGAQLTYDTYGNLEKTQHLNLASAVDYTYSYSYDSQQRLKKITLGSITLAEFDYSKTNNTITNTMKVNGQNITYTYDENERLISKSNGDNFLYEYTYDDETTRVKSIKNLSTDESIDFKYDGKLLSKIISGTYKEEYQYNDNQNIFATSKYINDNLVAIEKHTDTTLQSQKQTILSFANMVYQNEGDNVYLTTFTKQIVKVKYEDTYQDVDISNDLKGKLSDQIIKQTQLNISNQYGYEGLPYINFSENNFGLVYPFEQNATLQSKYSIFFGYQLNNIDFNTPVLTLGEGSEYYKEKIKLFISNNKLKFVMGIQSTTNLFEEAFTVNINQNKINFVALNVSCNELPTGSYKYDIDVYFNGVLAGKIENVVMETTMKYMYVMGDSLSSTNVGKISSLFVKTDSHISGSNIAQYSNLLSDIYNNSKLFTHNFNKQTRLSNTQLPIVCFDNTLNSIVGNVKPYEFIENKNTTSYLDNFTPDTETGENIYVIKNQVLSYNFNLPTSGIAGVRFKRIEGTRTEIFSLVSNQLTVLLSVLNTGKLEVKVNSTSYYPVSIDSSWNNIFIKWEKKIASSSIEEYIYTITLFVNETSYNLGEYDFDSNLTDIIMYIGKKEILSSDQQDCYGYIEKAVGCSDSTSVSTLNSLFNNYGDSATNKYDEFGLKTIKKIKTSDSLDILQTFTYDTSSEGRVLGTLTSDTIEIKSNNNIVNNYSYNLDKSLRSQITYISSTNTNKAKSFTYDNKQQLTKLVDDTNTYLYTYDNMGNITQIKKNNSIIHTASYTNGILLNTVNGYTISYDSSGYPIAKKSGTVDIERYTWIGGKLESFEYVQQQRKIVFTYAANGLRTSKKEYQGTTLCNTTNYYYNAAGLLAYETRTSNNIKLEYLYDAEGSLYGVYYNGTPYYYIKDALGTITHLVDSNRNIVTRFDYDGAYGKHSTVDVNSVGSTHITFINPFRYKGYYYDVETQLFYCNSRYYSPELCRWISPDSIEYLDPESINGLNLYTYCGNDPINRYDPSGHAWDWVLDIVSIAWSLYDFIKDPTWENAGWLALDVVLGIIPVVPAIGKVLKGLSKVDDVVDIGKGINRLDDVHDAIVIGNGMDRVKDAARIYDAAYYGGYAPLNALVDAGKFSEASVKMKLLARVDNAKWLFKNVFAGAKIIDIGKDGRNIVKWFISAYGMERRLLFYWWHGGHTITRLIRLF